MIPCLEFNLNFSVFFLFHNSISFVKPVYCKCMMAGVSDSIESISWVVVVWTTVSHCSQANVTNMKSIAF